LARIDDSAEYRLALKMTSYIEDEVILCGFEMPKVAICFFGITRSLSHTISSIECNVLDPARKLGNVSIYSHFFLQKNIINPRSGEQGQNKLDEHRLLPSDWIQLEEPDACLSHYDFDALKSWGDAWNDDFMSLRNLVHQLHSLSAVTTAALADGADICLFCRPDLTYHDSLSRPIKRAVSARAPMVLLPYWQPCGGLNDRFAICAGRDAISAYGHRIRSAHDFCAVTSSPLHSELLLAYSLADVKVDIHRIASRASRTRLGGAQKDEEFSRPWVIQLKYRLRPRSILVMLADSLGLRPTIRKLLMKIRS
jgi:hypothetical protein